MHFSVRFLAACAILSTCNANFYPNNFTDFNKCEVVYTRRTSLYNDFFTLPPPTDARLAVDFHFSVLAPSDAHILLAPNDKVTATDDVYEIVIGAGGNSFSDIRRRIKSDVLASLRQTKLLSSVDVTSFWIHIDKTGLISVGKEGEQIAFLTYQDTERIDVAVFSFSIWENYEAKWFYNCPRDNNRKTRTQTVTDRLRQDLLNVKSSLRSNQMMNINVSLETRFISLNEQQSTMTLQSRAFITWREDLLRWTPNNYSGIQTIAMQKSEIWAPELIVTNTEDIGEIQPFRGKIVKVLYTGKVEWLTTFSITTLCNLESIEHWPQDKHTCNIDISTWHKDIDNLRIDFLQSSQMPTPHKESMIEGSWKILLVTSETYKYPALDGSHNASIDMYLRRMPPLRLRFQIKRSVDVYNFIFHAIMLLVLTLAIINFWSSPFDAMKCSIVGAQFMLTVIGKLSLAVVLPMHNEKVPLLVYKFGSLMLGNVISLLITIIVLNISRNTHDFEPPHVLTRFIQNHTLEKMLLLPSFAPKGTSSYSIAMQSQRRKSLVQDVWIRLGTIIDRFAFLAYFVLTLYVLLIC